MSANFKRSASRTTLEDKVKLLTRIEPDLYFFLKENALDERKTLNYLVENILENYRLDEQKKLARKNK